VTLEPGDLISRFGPPSGNFAAPEETPWSQRSLPPTSIIPDQGESSSFHVYAFTDKWASDPPPVVVTQSTTAPAFEWLMDHDYLTEKKA
jgi:hypothetical protein